MPESTSLYNLLNGRLAELVDKLENIDDGGWKDAALAWQYLYELSIKENFEHKLNLIDQMAEEIEIKKRYEGEELIFYANIKAAGRKIKGEGRNFANIIDDLYDQIVK